MHSTLTNLKWLLCVIITLAASLQAGCSGLQTFTHTARAGDTIAVTFPGSYINANRNNATVTIKDSANAQTVYMPGDSNVRAIFNLYPDPVSYLTVGTETNQNFRGHELELTWYADAAAGWSRDWFQTVAFLDLPPTLAQGNATVTIDVNGSKYNSTVKIIAGTGASHNFDVQYQPPYITGDERLQSLERAPYYKISLSGTASDLARVQAIDAVFLHDSDVDNGGVGKAHVVAARGDITSLHWSDNGIDLHVILSPTRTSVDHPDRSFMFYVTGGIAGLTLQELTAIDANGDVVAGVGIQLSQAMY